MPQVPNLNFTNFIEFGSGSLAGPGLVAFIGTNLQLAGVSSMVHATVDPLLAQHGVNATDLEIQHEAEKYIWELTSGQASFSSVSVMESLLNATYASLAGSVSENTYGQQARVSIFTAAAEVGGGACVHVHNSSSRSIGNAL